jgi:sugar phosphate isomerase/epimerase
MVLMIRFGCCTGDIKHVEILKKLGYDYIELGLFQMMDKTEDEVSEWVSELEKHSLPCEAMNCFVPGRIKLVGDDVDQVAVDEYLNSALALANRLNVKIIVFGSGGARNIPDGFEKCEAEKQIISFLKTASKKADKYGLNKAECTFINTTVEAYNIAKAVGCANVRILVDWYHAYLERESAENASVVGDYVVHCHIADPTRNRAFPLFYDGVRDFMYLLKRGGYDGRLSIEGSTERFEDDANVALGVLKGLS